VQEPAITKERPGKLQEQNPTGLTRASTYNQQMRAYIDPTGELRALTAEEAKTLDKSVPQCLEASWRTSTDQVSRWDDIDTIR
jgi:hypothetical protein